MTILIKLSGESLSGKYEHGFDFEYMREVCARIKRIGYKTFSVTLISDTEICQMLIEKVSYLLNG